ncbi:TrkH family potassium uptake protein [Microlunatus elymi]|uniref:TrkH family potassium uptake protein n=2 Tax=Microlunatus elymi TaxID=2596828 RepID=A0A516Q502_9ACTN|nr:TrkH family potassium uptake protein [Microlunatus elymi]
MLRRRVPETKRTLPGVRNPGRAIVAGFGLVVIIGTVLLSLPISSAGGDPTPLLKSLFTAVSAVCVTGLVVVDVATYFSTFGQVVLLVLIQIGGTGVMTLATLIGLIVNHRIGLRMQVTARAESKAFSAGDVPGVIRRVALMTVTIEAAVALVLAVGFARDHRVHSLGEAIYYGVFHSISAFNNAGFSLFSDNLVGFVGDPLICVPIMLAIIVGGIGFPVLAEIQRRTRRTGRPRRLGLHTTITLFTTAVLVVVGSIAFLVSEWSNPKTLAPLPLPEQILASIFGAVVPRTAGFNSLDVAAFRPETLLLNDILMFIGGGSAGTAGGIKVTTFALLAFVVLAELRGEPSVHVRNRQLPTTVIRQALAVALLALTLVVASTMAIMAMTGYSMDRVLFEVVSAFATVGLSTGITGRLPSAAQLILIGLMFVGRLGPITLGSALALRDRPRRYEYPEERPLVG